MRKLANVRKITDIHTIPDKDRIVQYLLDGWMVIDQKDRYQIGDLVVYIEPDSWVPTALAPFLSKGKEPREFQGIKGEKLKTIRLGGAISQGLLFPLQLDAHAQISLPVIPGVTEQITPVNEGDDLSELLGIVKWELPPPVHTNAKGNFPSFIPKTDQERVQNMAKLLAKRDSAESYELTEKLEGQSFTAYWHEGVFGVCSRNLEVQLEQESTWKYTAEFYQLEQKLRDYCQQHACSLALQGEQVGPGIEGNIYGLQSVKLYLFDVFDIEAQAYLSPAQARQIIAALGLDYVPVLHENFVLADLLHPLATLELAHRCSALNKVVAEGIVLKSNRPDQRFSFKAVSNEYLLKEKQATAWNN